MDDDAPTAADQPTSTRAHVATLVRAWRERALLTQEQLALRAGLGVRTIRRLESGGSTKPRDCSVSLLADALNLPVEERARFVAAVRAA